MRNNAGTYKADGIYAVPMKPFSGRTITLSRYGSVARRFAPLGRGLRSPSQPPPGAWYEPKGEGWEGDRNPLPRSAATGWVIRMRTLYKPHAVTDKRDGQARPLRGLWGTGFSLFGSPPSGRRSRCGQGVFTFLFSCPGRHSRCSEAVGIPRYFSGT